MKNIFTFLLLVFIGGQFLWGQPANLVWNTQSRNASESMPCGGGDIGMNVWVYFISNYKSSFLLKNYFSCDR